ncbi:hypothetical protein CPB83DRAFT_795877 [Crepidotus variabilis]|uniref:Uncharacterized protein n=1 Tax=Crepidotus variabilis TaxID=179855 RepID=A0A9P6EB88_9AGAR|nr:hypothetical protein CPB83DRAFT_795877 [Crepidotus variabilis]
MFRTCLTSGSRLVFSSPSSSSFFHTSSTNLSHASKRMSARTKKKNIARTAERAKQADVDKPSVVLGTRPNEESEKWANCKLAKILVTEESLAASTEMNSRDFSIGKVELPKEFGFGVTEKEAEVLFEDLPIASQHMTTQVSQYAQDAPGKISPVPKKQMPTHGMVTEEAEREVMKANFLAKALDLRNANAAGIAFENRRRIIQAFSSPENSFDSGRTEVQVALLTYKIRNLWKHLLTFRRDVGNRRGLRDLIHQRAKHLKYLKKSHRARYDALLDELALDPSSVEGELVV